VNFVLDTNVVSELRKPRPDANVSSWVAVQDIAHTFIFTITLAEVWQGFHSLPLTHPDYSKIKKFVMDLPQQYRVLNFDSRAAEIWGKITAQSQSPLPLRDSLIAAIALSRGYRVATRDTSPFERAGCKVVNQWTSQLSR
jgi:predicted nucleic acid-binding protein